MSIVAEDLARLQNRPVSATLLAPSNPGPAPANGAPDTAGEPWRLARLERWVLRGGAFLLPLAFSWDTYDGYALPKLLLARILVIALLLLWLARVATTRAPIFKRTALDLPLLAFVLSAAISTLFAYNQNVAVFGTYSRYDGLLTILTYAALFWLSAQALANATDARALLRVLLAGGYVVAALAIVQSMTDSIGQGQLAPAFGPLGQKNALGAYLAMLLPLAYGELVAATSWPSRVMAVNAMAVLGVALFLTFSRSAWIAAAAALLIIGLAVHRGWRARLAAGAGAAAVVAAFGLVLLQVPGVPLERTDLTQAGDRPAVWKDSLSLIASRPILGFGPDNFGLVFPAFESADLHQPWDKAHAETLQVAATQGFVGLAAYAWLVGAFLQAFWRSRRDITAYAVLTAWIGYQLTIQVNFTALAAAFPFWVFAAAAVEVLGATRRRSPAVARYRPLLAGAAALGAVMLMGLAVVGVAYPYLADSNLRSAVIADYSGHRDQALGPADQARLLAPQESVYAVEVGNIAFEKGDWAAAREAYGDAAMLGTFNPAVYRNLALADLRLGLFDEARAAARHAVELDRFDPVNRALLAQFEPAP